jgi:hypothetical protein
LADLLILTADELKALNPLERQAARRAAREQPLMRLILRTVLQRGGPIPVEGIIAASPAARPDAIHDALVVLDDEDLIRVRAGQIDLAYPLSARRRRSSFDSPTARSDTPAARPTRSASRR